MKRTTMVLDPTLFAQLKRRAADEGRTLTEVVERLLRLGLQAAAAGRRSRVQLPSYDLGPFLVDSADRAALGATPPAEAAEGVRPVRRSR